MDKDNLHPLLEVTVIKAGFTFDDLVAHSEQVEIVRSIHTSSATLVINSQWITPSKFHQTHNITLRPNRFFYDNFDRLTETEPLFRGVRVAVINPFSSHVTILLINLSFMGFSISWRQISTLCWSVNSWDTDLQLLYDFPSILILQCMVSFDATSSSHGLWVLFCGSSSKTMGIFTILHNLELPESGKFLVFSYSFETLESSLRHTLTKDSFSHFTYSSTRGSNCIILFTVVF